MLTCQVSEAASTSLPDSEPRFKVDDAPAAANETSPQPSVSSVATVLLQIAGAAESALGGVTDNTPITRALGFTRVEAVADPPRKSAKLKESIKHAANAQKRRVVGEMLGSRRNIALIIGNSLLGLKQSNVLLDTATVFHV